MQQGITPKMGWSHGELEIKVNGERVFSHKEEHTTPDDSVLLKRVNDKLQR